MAITAAIKVGRLTKVDIQLARIRYARNLKYAKSRHGPTNLPVGSSISSSAEVPVIRGDAA
jgi:hypothetical protein